MERQIRVSLHVKCIFPLAAVVVTSSYLFGEAEPVLQVQAEATVSWFLLSRRAQAILLNSDPRRRTTRPVTTASEHLTHSLVVQVHVEVRGHLPPFSYIQQSQRHEEGFKLVEQIQHAEVSFESCLHNGLKVSVSNPHICDGSSFTLVDAALQHEVE